MKSSTRNRMKLVKISEFTCKHPLWGYSHDTGMTSILEWVPFQNEVRTSCIHMTKSIGSRFSRQIKKSKDGASFAWNIGISPSYSRILIASRLWSIRGQTHSWRQHKKLLIIHYRKLIDSMLPCVFLIDHRRRQNVARTFRITSLNVVRMALKSAQETSRGHVWGRKPLFHMR